MNGCRCCGLAHVDEDGLCELCLARGHTVPPPPVRQQTTPRNRQINHPGRDR